MTTDRLSRRAEEMLSLSPAERAELIGRCARVIDSFGAAALEAVRDIVQNLPSQEAMRILLSNPEAFAIQALEMTLAGGAHRPQAEVGPRSNRSTGRPAAE